MLEAHISAISLPSGILSPPLSFHSEHHDPQDTSVCLPQKVLQACKHYPSVPSLSIDPSFPFHLT